MQLLLATMGFRVAGGSETYLLTVAEHLQRLGHEVTIYAIDVGMMADLAARRGFRVITERRRLPLTCDFALVQDGAVSYELADHYPATPQLFRAASDLHDLQLPPQLPGVVAAVLVLSDRVRERVRATALRPEVIRMRQPVDTQRFTPGPPIGEMPRRALLLGNYLEGPRRDAIVAALTANGIVATQLGATAEPTLDPTRAIWDADIVIAKGRAALEAMSCGRAVYVYDAFGTDGWVTAESYGPFEADSFAGNATDAVTSADRMARELALYSPEMGLVNRDLVVRHHTVRRHAQELCAEFASLVPPSLPSDAPLRELARLVRSQWVADLRADALERENIDLRKRLGAYAQEAQDALSAERRRFEELTETRRYRLAASLGRIADTLRRNGR